MEINNVSDRPIGHAEYRHHPHDERIQAKIEAQRAQQRELRERMAADPIDPRVVSAAKPTGKHRDEIADQLAMNLLHSQLRYAVYSFLQQNQPDDTVCTITFPIPGYGAFKIETHAAVLPLVRDVLAAR